MDRRAGRQARTQIKNCSTPSFRHLPHSGGDEVPVRPVHSLDPWVHLGHRPGQFPVDGEIVLPAEPVIVDTGDVRPCRVESRHAAPPPVILNAAPAHRMPRRNPGP